ncbi:HEAT repeat domain-containing protein [Roseofilum sp. Guam]|uniref:HEAT repeat domain-containing protein n=1 Tax=Roseofilum sp. Guam TaxID=2821502 RepID=UPI001B178D90|nr:HEAT repeat domain-containing protein [Roseofilum sp. Guam]MBP0027267.1 hypothetical protein [Roseofilum sp. Guam]
MDIPDIELQELEAEFGHEFVQELHKFSSDDHNVREEALDKVRDRIFYQGDVHNKVGLVLPFFIRQIYKETDTEFLFSILCCIASIAISDNLSCLDSLDESDEYDRSYQKWVNSVRKPIYQALDFYIGLLEHEIPKMRIIAADILAACKPQSTNVCTKFYDRLRQEPEPNIRASLLLLLAILDGETPLDKMFCEEILQSDDAEIVKLAAAISLMYVARENPSQELLEQFIELGDCPDILLQLSNHFDSWYADGRGLFVNFFDRLSNRVLEQLMPTLTYRWAFLYYYNNCNLLFELVFPEGVMKPGTAVNTLTNSQQFLLRAIADNKEAWESGFNIRCTIEYSLIYIGIKEKPKREKLIRFLSGEAL